MARRTVSVTRTRGFSGAGVQYAAGTQSINSGDVTALTWDTEDFDTAGFWSAGSATRLTTTVGGFYLILGAAAWDTNTTGGRALDIRKNGTTTITSVFHAANNPCRQTLSALNQCVPGDYFEITAFQDSGAARTVAANPHFWIYYLGPF